MITSHSLGHSYLASAVSLINLGLVATTRHSIRVESYSMSGRIITLKKVLKVLARVTVALRSIGRTVGGGAFYA